MMRQVVTVVWLTVVWVALWEQLTWANVLGGLAASAAVVAFVPPRRPVGPRLGFRPLRALWLGLYFLWKLTEASAFLAFEVVTPRNRVRPAIVSVDLSTSSHAIATLVANLVSLTPGTLTLEVDEETLTLYIHVLHLSTFEGLREDVLSFERLSLAAFPEEPAEPGVEAVGGHR